MNQKCTYKKGDKIGTFTLVNVSPIDELHATLYELEHGRTGAKVMHIDCDDVENLFCISFQTLPKDSCGTAHILEHTVLCGSKKYPVKDPFFSMTRRSLNTFMNAMTGADFTCYPAASQVKQDFYNLFEVYLDAVFFPNLKKLSFLQEGHRLEFQKPTDVDSPLVYKGIVFNEMKGAMSAPEARLWNSLMEQLTPDLPYAYNSGGDPKEIPKLTYEELKNFHKTFYHPSRALFFFYRNLPLKNHLDCIEKNVLKSFEKVPPLPPNLKQNRFSSPKTCLTSYPLDVKKSDKKTYCAFTWLTTTIENQEEVLALSVLDSILMETDASPLKERLLKSGLCTQADGYIDLEMSEIPYTIICQGCNEKDQSALKTIIFKTLTELASKDFSPSLIEAALHQLEFSRLEINGDHGPFGLTLFMRAGLLKQHNSSPESGLKIYSQFNRLRNQVKEPSFFSSLINKYLVNNPHFVDLTMKPSPTLSEEETIFEQKELEKVRQNLSEKSLKDILDQTASLERFQKSSEKTSIECLPKILLKDVPKKALDFPLKKSHQGSISIFHHECFTNHILYADLLFDLPKVDIKDLPFFQLMLSILPELGVGNRSYKENLEYINAYLGDFSTSLNLHPQAEDPNRINPSFGFKGKVLDRNVDKLFALFKEICLSPHLGDKARIKELILQTHTMLENKLTKNALSYATLEASSGWGPFSYLRNQLSGLPYYTFIKQLTENIDTELIPLIETFQRLQKELFHLKSPHLILSCDQQQYLSLEKNKFYGLDELPAKEYAKWTNPSVKKPLSPQGRHISSPVAFSILGFQTEGKLKKHCAALSLSTEIIENCFLHSEIREKGGAYGAGANYSPVTGNYTLYSYRDPHIKRTFSTFKSSLEKIALGQFEQSDMMEAKLGLIQSFDTPVSPGMRAMSSYFYWRAKKGKQLRQDFRDKVLACTQKEVEEALRTHILFQKELGTAITFADTTLLQKEDPSLQIIPY